MAALPSLQDMLTAAQIALDAKVRGAMPTEVEIAGGLRTTFAATSVADLQTYISQLQAQLAGTQTRGAIGVIF